MLPHGIGIVLGLGVVCDRPGFWTGRAPRLVVLLGNRMALGGVFGGMRGWCNLAFSERFFIVHWFWFSRGGFLYLIEDV